MLGILLLEQNNPAKAWPALRRAVDTDPNNLALRHNLALAYLGAGFSKHSLEEIGWALESQKEDHAAADFILGANAYRSAKYEDASNHLLSANHGRQDFFEAQTLLALAYSAMDKREEAHTLYSAVLAQHPTDPVAKGGLEMLSFVPKGAISPEQLPQFVIPYSKLVAKSEYWPLFP
jgi:tetratricopeptide (TPR) repeat protein